MRMIRCQALSIFVMLLAVSVSVTGLAATGTDEPDPEAILRQMDDAISGYQDQAMDVTMTILDTDGSKKSYDFSILQKGASLRMIRMLSGELKGMATLVEDRDRVYVYLPGFKKVRRVASHNMNQTFAGSDFTNDDMAATTWANEYDATLEREDDSNWYLRCKPKPGAKALHPEALLVIDKLHGYQVSVEYLDADGTPVRRQDSSNLSDFGGAKRFSKVVMTDMRSGHSTILSIRDFRVNRGLEDSLFSVRALEWSR